MAEKVFTSARYVVQMHHITHSEKIFGFLDFLAILRSEHLIDILYDSLNVRGTVLGHMSTYRLKKFPEVPDRHSD